MKKIQNIKNTEHKVTELISVLESQMAAHPQMQIADVFKLVYQNEFGCGHLVTDEGGSLHKLESELKQICCSPISLSCESIGNGLCRINFKASHPASAAQSCRITVPVGMEAASAGTTAGTTAGTLDGALAGTTDVTSGGVSAGSLGVISAGVNAGFHINTATINKMFVNTASQTRGSDKGFELKMEAIIDTEILPFKKDDLLGYLERIRNAGYKPVSHSETYRSEYSPAYRVISSDYCRYMEVFARIDSSAGRRQRIGESRGRDEESGESRGRDEESGGNRSEERTKITVAIDGRSGAGKSSLAALIASLYPCNVFHMDHYFLPETMKTAGRLGEPGGNIHYERFNNEVIRGIKSGKEFGYRIYDCQTGTLGEPIRIKPVKINIVEGCYSLHPAIRSGDNWNGNRTNRDRENNINENSGIYDVKIFLDINEEEQWRRILERNGPELFERFVSEWIPMEEKYINAFKIIRGSDLVFPRDNYVSGLVEFMP